MTLFTIGHSNQALSELIALLRKAKIQELVDVRSIPRSRRHPQFNAGSLQAALQEIGVQYSHAPELGGKRDAVEGASPNGFWREEAFRNYADYAMTKPFRAALEQLLHRAKKKRICIMCAEADWRDCHRQIITDYALDCGETVTHLLKDGSAEPAGMNQAAVRRKDGRLEYPPQQKKMI